MSSNKMEDAAPSGEVHDNSYTTGRDAKVNPVVSDDAGVEDPYKGTNPDSDTQLGKLLLPRNQRRASELTPEPQSATIMKPSTRATSSVATARAMPSRRARTASPATWRAWSKPRALVAVPLPPP